MMKVHENFASAVSRVIFSNNDLKVEICSLGQNAFKRSRDEFLMIIGNYHHAEFHVCSTSSDIALTLFFALNRALQL